MKRTFMTIDVETTGLNPRKDVLHGLGVAWEEDSLKYFRAGDFPNVLLDHLSNPHIDKVGHNLRFDLEFLQANQIEVKGRIWDTKILAQMVNENQPLGLKDLSIKYLGEWALEGKRELDHICSKAQVKHVGELCAKDFKDGKYFDAIAKYCMEDCNNTVKLFYVLLENLKKQCATYKKRFNIEKSPMNYFIDEAMALEPVLQAIEMRGIRVNLDKIERVDKRIEEEIGKRLNGLSQSCAKHVDQIEDRLFKQALLKRKSPKGRASVVKGSEKYKTQFNWQSNDHVAELFFDHLKFPVLNKTKSGKRCLDKKVVSVLTERVNHPVPKLFAEYTKLKDQRKTFVGNDEKGLRSHLEDDRIHGQFVATGTVTGRLSSKKPNMQNIPRRGPYRSFFIPDTEAHKFVYFDYSQLEYRLAAHLSGDLSMIADYHDGIDLHSRTAQEEELSRQVAKTVNFLVIYRGGAWKLHKELGCSLIRAQSIIDNFKSRYPVFEEWLAEQEKFMTRYGIIFNEVGRARRLPGLLKHTPEEKEFKHALKQGFNFPVQSLGASITKRAMIELHKRGFQLVTQVHDSVVCQLPIGSLHRAAEIKEIAETVYPLRVPLVADIKVLNSLSEEDIYERTGNSERAEGTRQSHLKLVGQR